jgi:hypothetical protein
VEPSSGLFENRREANLSSIAAMVEDVLIELGHFVNECRVDAPGATYAWRIFKGSASVRISLLDNEDESFPSIRIAAAVMTTDARVDINKLYRHLLTLNNQAVKGAAFAAQQNEILLVAERSSLDLDRSEVHDLIHRVQEYADKYDDELVDEYGGRLGGND